MTHSNSNHRYSAAVAASMKLKTIYDGSHSRGQIDYIARGYQAMIWSAVEHGLSIFASSLLALRPLIRLVPKGWTNIFSTFSGGGSADPSGQGSSRRTIKKSNWSSVIESNELGSIGVQNSISVRTEYAVDCHAQKSGYRAEVFASRFESSDRLV